MIHTKFLIMWLGQKSIHLVKIYHLNLFIINSIEYSRCAKRESVWPIFSNLNTDCHSGSCFSEMRMFTNNSSQLVWLGSGGRSELTCHLSTEPAECCRQYWPCHSHVKKETSVNGWILEKTVKNGLTLDQWHIVSIQDNWL